MHGELTAGTGGRRLGRALLWAGLLAALPLLVLWTTGGIDALARWAAEGQRQSQNSLAGSLRGLRAGEAGAFLALMGVAFAYGVFHAAGPGHGKVLIGGYGLGRRVPLWRLAGLALVSSLAQATTAVLLVAAGILVLGWTREHLVGVAEGVMLPVSHLMVAAIGAWLAWRGFRGLRRSLAARDHHHHHHHDEHCGHRHAPTLAEVSALTTWREGLALVLGVAARPCTGALFLLVLTWQMGIPLAGIAGTYAMGLGTAAVTVAVAVLAVWSREGALAALASGRLARAVPVLELAAGLAIAALSLVLLGKSI